jgi:hypothetical protein
MQRGRRAATLFVLLVGVLANEAAGQPYGWVSNGSTLFLPSVPAPARSVVSVVNLATGGGVTTFDVPPGIGIGAGALTPDGRYYLIPTSIGIARFSTNPPAFERMLATGVFVTAIAIAPTGRRLYANGAFGRAVLDWETGLLERVDCCAQPRIGFTPDGMVRSADLGSIVVPGDRLSVTQDVASIRAFVRIRARNACGESAPSTEVLVSTR